MHKSILWCRAEMVILKQVPTRIHQRMEAVNPITSP
jgi:hypothetical protein